MSTFKIPHLDHEVQVNHTNHAVQLFVNGTFDYITASAPVNVERINIFSVTRDKEDKNRFRISDAGGGVVDEYTVAGQISYIDIKKHVLNIIDDFEAKHGFRNHEDMPRCILWVGGKY